MRELPTNIISRNNIIFFLCFSFILILQSHFAIGQNNQKTQVVEPNQVEFNFPIENFKECGVSQMIQDFATNDPEGYEQAKRDFANQTRQVIQNLNSGSRSPDDPCPNGITVIPIAFNLCHENGAAVGTQHNYSVADLQFVIDQLNADFSGLNVDKDWLTEEFQMVDAGHTCIQFCIGKVNRLAQATCAACNGGDHNSITFCRPDGYGVGSANDPNDFLNIYSSSYPGFGLSSCIQTFTGGCGGDSDGVTVNWDYLIPSAAADPYGCGRTLTHQVAHWLGVPHVSGDDISSGGCTNDDTFSDTNDQSAQQLYFCGAAVPSSCGSTDNVFNYMDFSTDCALVQFTEQQAAQMQNVIANHKGDLNTSAERGNCDDSIYDTDCISVNAANSKSLSLNCTGTVNLLDEILTWYDVPAPTNSCSPNGYIIGGRNLLEIEITDPDGNIVICDYYDFADHEITYDSGCAAGDFTYKLLHKCWDPVTSSYSASAEAGTITINVTPCNSAPPAVDFTMDNSTVCLDTDPTVNFTDTSGGSPTGWSWDFGDSGSSTLQNPSHTYSATGTFTVELTVTYACGTNTKSYDVEVVSGAACAASCPGGDYGSLTSVGQVCSGTSVTFTSAATGCGGGGGGTSGPISLDGNTTGGMSYTRCELCGTFTAPGTHLYEATPFQVDATGSYTFANTQTGGWDGFLFVYDENWDPLDPCNNCLGSDDDGPSGAGTSQIDNLNLTVGTDYYFVVTGWSGAEFGPYTTSVTGPGDVIGVSTGGAGTVTYTFTVDGVAQPSVSHPCGDIVESYTLTHSGNQCSVDAQVINLTVVCDDSGDQILNSNKSVSVRPAPPANLASLVTISGEDTCDEPSVVAISNACNNYITITPAAGNPTFPVSPGTSGTASYTISYATPGALDCCPNAAACTTTVTADYDCEALPCTDCNDAACVTVQACNDNDCSTTNDMETILTLDNSVCVPCAGTPVTPPTCNTDCTQGDIETYNASNCMCEVTTVTVEGCTDATACNYNANANCDDDSCIPNTDPGTCNTDCTAGDLEEWNSSTCECDVTTVTVLGCTDATACNYNASANCDDSSCVPNTDPGTCNTDCTAGDLEEWNSSTCECDVTTVTVLGCTDATACNYNASANCDDDSCTSSADPGTCNTDCTAGDLEEWNVATCECDVISTPILGCTDATACNYDANATCDDGSCTSSADPGTCNTDCTAGDLEEWNVATCECEVTTVSVLGCTDATACNYDAAANCDDGSCTSSADPGTCNTDCTAGDLEEWNVATCECEVVSSPVLGCTDATACNYDAAATCDDGSCTSSADPGTCNTDCTAGDLEEWNVATCECDVTSVSVLGCTDQNSCNFEPTANCDDGSCISNADPGTCNTDCTIGDLEEWNATTCKCVVTEIVIPGCIDPTACNFDNAATCDDGTCIPNTDPGTCNTDCTVGDVEEWNPQTCECETTEATVLGCTNPNSCNFDEMANCDNGSCIPNDDPGTCNTDCNVGALEEWDFDNCECVETGSLIEGCTDPNFCNYDASANCDNGSCTNENPGICETDCSVSIEAWNPETCSCEASTSIVIGCTNPNSCNFEPQANCDDGSCIPNDDPGLCNTDCTVGDVEEWDFDDCECVVVAVTVYGCLDPTDCNFNSEANCEDDSCLGDSDPGTCNTECTAGDIEEWNSENCQCEVILFITQGCTDPDACNYDATANCEDNSCNFGADPSSCNTDCSLGDLETFNIETCICEITTIVVDGCTDATACNFDPNANCDDGSCTDSSDPGTCNTDCTAGDLEEWNVANCECETTTIVVNGCTDQTACNFDPNANCDDGSCTDSSDPGTCNTDCTAGDLEEWNIANCECEVTTITIEGCTDPAYCNFDDDANCDDGSCTNENPGSVCNTDCSEGNIEVWNPETCACEVTTTIVEGCTNPNSCNFDATANCDDGSCQSNDDPGTCNTDCTVGDLEEWNATNCECETTSLVVIGCTDPTACNYDETANCDDDSCSGIADPDSCNDDCSLGNIEEWNAATCACEVIVEVVEGCTDADACNYNPAANCEDNSCTNQNPGTCNNDCSTGNVEIWNSETCECETTTISIEGCTNPNACNYNEEATCDDGSCSNLDPGTCNTDCTQGNLEVWNTTTCSCVLDELVITGCTDPTACNYDANANCEDGSCNAVADPSSCNTDCLQGDIEEWNNEACECVVIQSIIIGCTEINSCNYNPEANCEDGSCISKEDPGTCNNDCLAGDLEEWNTETCLCEISSVSIPGCTNQQACNYDPEANCDDGSCSNGNTGICNTDCTQGNLETWDINNCQCVVTTFVINGCTDANACNFNPLANCDDGSCSDSDPGICNVDCDQGDLEEWNTTTCQCEVAVITIAGCMDENSCNYNPNANCPDDSCIDNSDPGTCNSDCSQGNISVWNTSTCQCEVTNIVINGCLDPNACNYNSNANCSNNSCEYGDSNCDDNNCLTDDYYDPETCACVYTEIAIPDCDDNNCQTIDIFDPNTCECIHGSLSPPSCNDFNCTTVDFYNPETCECVNAPLPIPSCDDNDCNTADVYNTQTCECENNPISPTACDDQNCLTVDQYNEATCQCENIASPLPNCDDNDCGTIDSYDPETCQCVNIAAEEANCDDNNCLTDDYYDADFCQCIYKPIVLPTCDDNNCLTEDTYNTNICECINTPIETPDCDDNNCNTADSFDESSCKCINEVIASPNCDDDDCTTIDVYNTQTCECENMSTEQASCNDNDCSTTDVYDTDLCECIYTPLPTPNCNDNDCLTFDFYNTQTCECVYTTVPTPTCDDNDCSTIDSYNENTCSCVYAPIAELDCDDNNCLTEDSYNEQNCECVNTAIAQPDCDDNDCNTADVYNSQTCECENNPISPTACDDQNCQTEDYYDEATCNCVHALLPTPNCNDNNCLTDDSYNYATCQCENIELTVPDCDDNNCTTTDFYNYNTCECINATMVQPNCNDNDCNTADVYNTSTCECENNPISPSACDDQDCGTEDSYNEATCACIHTPIPIPTCNDNNCLTEDSYDNDNCQCINTPLPEPDCNDNNCTTTDFFDLNSCQCINATMPAPSCDDQDCNTADVYNTQTCECENNPISPTACDDQNCLTADSYDDEICACVHTLLAEPDCNDNDCTTDDYYNPATCECINNTIPTPNCDDNNCLTQDAYNDEICECVNTPLQAPVCDDNDCTTEDSYDENSCECVYNALPTPNCDDNNCTTTDSYDEVNCICLNEAQAQPTCDDNDCNTADVYNTQTCECENNPISPTACDDQNCLTEDAYDDEICACVHTQIQVPDCNDNNCQTEEYYNIATCECVYETIPTPVCDDNNCLTEDSYNDEICECVYEGLPTPVCDDNNCLTEGYFDQDLCECLFIEIQIPDCNDNNCGTADFYDPASCQCVYEELDLPDCNDDDCNTADVYNTLTCQCENDPISPTACNDQNCLTEDSYDEASCACVHTLLATPNCDDNDCGTEDYYDTASCQCVNDEVAQPDCDDNDCSTDDSYDTANCQCLNLPILQLPCDDNDCTTEDSYDSNTCECIYTTVVETDCNDFNCTTVDFFNPETCQCENTQMPIPSCNDDDCNTADVYNNQTCECENNPISPTACDDQNCLTEDYYDETNCACVHTFVSPPNCDDNNCSTEDYYDPASCQCVNYEVALPDCDDNDCSTEDSFDESTCECLNITIPQLPCDDNDCTTEDSYDSNNCECVFTPVVSTDCNDFNCTTVDFFDPETCECVNSQLPIPSCDDNDCNTADVYNNQTCECENNPISPTACDDQNCLTEDSYDEANCICVHEAIAIPDCNDNDCSTEDYYSVESCHCVNNPINAVLDCDDNDCSTADSFDANTCECVNVEIPQASCDDNDCTTEDYYDSNTCQCIYTSILTDCEDNNCTTVDYFNPETCECVNSQLPIPSCDDNDCNTADVYNTQTCECENNPISPTACDDQNCLTEDYYDEANCTCVNSISPVPNCDDNDCATEDSYDAQNCECVNLPIDIPSCDDNNCLTEDSFNPTSCECIYTAIEQPNCDDGFCNTVDVFNPETCQCEYSEVTAGSCDDNNCLTEDSYNFNTCECEHIQIDIPACETTDCMTEGTFDPQICDCVYTPVTIPNCDDFDCSTADYYDSNACECIHANIPSLDCNDGDCSTVDVFDSETCLCEHIPVSPTACDDNNCLTDDYYDENSCQCVNLPIPTPDCDGDPCSNGGVYSFDPVSCGCVLIQPTVSGCTNPNANNFNPLANCDDGSCNTNCLGSISGSITGDANCDGSAGESLGGIQVELIFDGCTSGSNCPTTTTDENGVYIFSNLNCGEYDIYVVETSLPCLQYTSNNPRTGISVSSGDNQANADFAFTNCGEPAMVDIGRVCNGNAIYVIDPTDEFGTKPFGDGENYTFNWYEGNNLLQSYYGHPFFNPDALGSFTVQIVDSEGCIIYISNVPYVIDELIDCTD